MRDLDGTGLGSDARSCANASEMISGTSSARAGPALPFRNRRQNAGLIAHLMQQAKTFADGGENMSPAMQRTRELQA